MKIYNNKGEVKTAAQEGEVSAFDLAIIIDEHPEFVDNDITKLVYEKEFNFFINQAFSAIEKGIQNTDFKSIEFKAALRSIRNAEVTVEVAKDLKIDIGIDYSLLKEAIKQLYSLASDDFKLSLYFLNYINKATSDFGNCEDHIEKILPGLAQEYTKPLLKLLRKTAKRFRGSRKTTRYGNNLSKYLEELELIKDYIIYPHKEIEEIKSIAFDRGVLYFLKEAKNLPEDDPKKIEYEKVAQKNAELLEREIPLEYQKDLPL